MTGCFSVLFLHSIYYICSLDSYIRKDAAGAIAFFDRAGRALRGDFVTPKGKINPFVVKNQ